MLRSITERRWRYRSTRVSTVQDGSVSHQWPWETRSRENGVRGRLMQRRLIDCSFPATLRPGTRGHDCRAGTRHRDRPQLLALPRVATDLVDIIDGHRACERRPILARCVVDNAVSDLLAWKPQLGGCRLSIPEISRSGCLGDLVTARRAREWVLLGERSRRRGGPPAGRREAP